MHNCQTSAEKHAELISAWNIQLIHKRRVFHSSILWSMKSKVVSDIKNIILVFIFRLLVTLNTGSK